jgi:hypothetical protein
MEINGFDDVVYYVEKCTDTLSAVRKAAHNLPPDADRVHVDAIRAAIRAFVLECDRIIAAHEDATA